MAGLSGVALLFAQAPYGVWPLTFLGPALLAAAVWRAPAQSIWGKPWVLGALAGLTFFGPLLSWLILPAGLIGFVLLVATQTVYFAALAAVIKRLQNLRYAALAVGAVWTAVDVVRGTFPLGGFKWGAIAYAHVDGSWLLPVARLLGGHGVTWLVVTISIAALGVVTETVTMARNRKNQNADQSLSLRHIPTATLIVSLFASVLLTIEPPPTRGTLDVLAVQGNDVKHWLENDRREDAPLRIVNAHAALTIGSVEQQGPPDVTFWPESAIDRDPFSARGENLLPAIVDATAQAGTLVAGITRDGPDPARQRTVGAAVFDGSGDLVDEYVKRRLVPFGEYIPARRYLDWFGPLDQIPRDALPGDGPQQVRLEDGTRIAVVICFETMFSPVVRSNIRVDDDAHLIAVLTNNASFGVSGAPYQHIAQSRLLAVETGRWVVHAAISGASAIIDPWGRIHEQTDLFTLDTLRQDVPLADGVTPFLLTGDLAGAGALGITILLGALPLARRTRAALSHSSP